jgi:hypothetical protein
MEAPRRSEVPRFKTPSFPLHPTSYRLSAYLHFLQTIKGVRASSLDTKLDLLLQRHSWPHTAASDVCIASPSLLPSFLPFLMRLRFELRASHLQTKHSTTWDTPPVHLGLIILEMGVSQTICEAWLWTAILLISASQVTRLATSAALSFFVFYGDEDGTRASHLSMCSTTELHPSL